MKKNKEEIKIISRRKSDLVEAYGNNLFQPCYLSSTKAYRGMDSYTIDELYDLDITKQTVSYINHIYNVVKKYHNFDLKNENDGFFLTVNDLRYFINGSTFSETSFSGYVALGGIDFIPCSELEQTAYDMETGVRIYDLETLRSTLYRNVAFERQDNGKHPVGPVVTLTEFFELMWDNGYLFYNQRGEKIDTILDLYQAKAVTIASKFTKEDKKEGKELAETFVKRLVKAKK